MALEIGHWDDHIQEMMCECHYEYPDGRKTILPAIIQPKYPSARN
jgi:hypothetical protein